MFTVPFCRSANAPAASSDEEFLQIMICIGSNAWSRPWQSSILQYLSTISWSTNASNAVCVALWRRPLFAGKGSAAVSAAAAAPAAAAAAVALSLAIFCLALLVALGILLGLRVEGRSTRRPEAANLDR